MKPDASTDSVFETHHESTSEAPSSGIVSKVETAHNDEAAGEWVDVDVAQSIPARRSKPLKSSVQAPAELGGDPLDLEGTSQALPRSNTVAVPPSGITALEPPVDAAPKVIANQAEPSAENNFSIIPGALRQQLDSGETSQRVEAVTELSRLTTDEAFSKICLAFDDRSQEVRNAAARALCDVGDNRIASFTRSLREAAPARRRNIGGAIASSGLAAEAINHLVGTTRGQMYGASSLLFLMAKAGEIQSLVRAIESHPSNEVRLAVIKLLALSGQVEVLPAFRRLALRGSLPTEVRSAVTEAIYQISSNQPATTS